MSQIQKERADRLGLEVAACDAESEENTSGKRRRQAPWEHEIEHSKAVSLKRIAAATEDLARWLSHWNWDGAMQVRNVGDR